MRNNNAYHLVIAILAQGVLNLGFFPFPALTFSHPGNKLKVFKFRLKCRAQACIAEHKPASVLSFACRIHLSCEYWVGRGAAKC